MNTNPDVWLYKNKIWTQNGFEGRNTERSCEAVEKQSMLGNPKAKHGPSVSPGEDSAKGYEVMPKRTQEGTRSGFQWLLEG